MHHFTNRVGWGQPPDSENGDALNRTNGQGIKDNDQHLDCADELGGRPAKLFATLQAQLALRGYELRPTNTGTYIVARCGLNTAPMASLDEVREFALQVGVHRG
jgi:hypothetical protein